MATEKRGVEPKVCVDTRKSLVEHKTALVQQLSIKLWPSQSRGSPGLSSLCIFKPEGMPNTHDEKSSLYFNDLQIAQEQSQGANMFQGTSRPLSSGFYHL